MIQTYSNFSTRFFPIQPKVFYQYSATPSPCTHNHFQPFWLCTILYDIGYLNRRKGSFFQRYFRQNHRAVGLRYTSGGWTYTNGLRRYTIMAFAKCIISCMNISVQCVCVCVCVRVTFFTTKDGSLVRLTSADMTMQ